LPTTAVAASTFDAGTASGYDRLVRGRLVLLAAVTLATSGVVPADVKTAVRAPIVYGYPYTARCPGAGIADVVDRWGMYACNCTSYVAWALSANKQRIDWFIPGAMNAWNWPHVARLSGLAVDRAPAVGAVAVWPKLARPFGHVAYVTGLGPKGTVGVAEYNYPQTGDVDTFAFDTRASVSTTGAVFIHVPERPLRRDAPLP
jgi:surface antigen